MKFCKLFESDNVQFPAVNRNKLSGYHGTFELKPITDNDLSSRRFCESTNKAFQKQGFDDWEFSLFLRKVDEDIWHKNMVLHLQAKMLKVLFDTYQHACKILVSINFFETDRSYPWTSVNSADMSIMPCDTEPLGICKETVTFSQSMPSHMRFTLEPDQDIQGASVTILLACASNSRSLHNDAIIFLNVLESPFTDVSVVAENGKEFRCNKSVLAAHSPVLASCFDNGWVESETNKIKMSDMSEPALFALLEYLYTKRLLILRTSTQPSVALEVFEAAHKYGIKPLESEIREILERTPNDLFDLGLFVKMFRFVRHLRLGESLVKKVLEGLKDTSPKDLNDCDEYKDLFKCDPAAAQELCTLSLGC